VPVLVAGGLTFRQLSAGYYHTCGITTQNALYCWGSNQDGQLGIGQAAFVAEPVKVP
jgi:alpha-tubulin suppressor-like RCC1 family protein